MLGWIREKMDTQESTPRGGRFFASGSIIVGNDALACSNPCVLGENYSVAVSNSFWDNAHTFDSSSRGERAENQVLWCNTHNV
jgi:hypothetical protein